MLHPVVQDRSTARGDLADPPLIQYRPRLLVRPATPGAGMFSSLLRGVYRLFGALWWVLVKALKVMGVLLYGAAWPIRVAMRWLDKHNLI